MAVQVSYPGVYVEEVSGGARPIAAAGTSTAAFFGVADKGPVDAMQKVFNFEGFRKTYGDFRSDGQFLAHSVFQFFNNGGKECYIGRVAVGATTASVTLSDRGENIPAFLGGAQTAGLSVTISAISPGIWGNSLNVRVTSDSTTPDLFDLTVIEEVENINTGQVEENIVEAFEDLSMNPSSSQFVETVVNSQSDFIDVAVELSADVDQNTVSAYVESGDIVAGTVLADDERQLQINIQGDGFRTIDITSRLDGEGRDSNSTVDIALALQETITGLTPLKSDANILTAYTGTTVSSIAGVDPGTTRLRIISGYSGQGSTMFIDRVADASLDAAGPLNLIGSESTTVDGSAFTRPNDTPQPGGEFEDYRLGDDIADDNISVVAPGGDGSLPQPSNYVTVFSRLDKIRDVSLIAVPGVTSTAVTDTAMNYCRNRKLSDCFYIADVHANAETVADVTTYQDGINTPNSYGAAYFPWLKALDPTGKSPVPILIPPSGFVAGVYSRTDSTRGVWKAPAGIEASLGGGVVGLQAELTDQEHGNLNKSKKSICVIRKFPDSGIVLWGARTLSSDPEHMYIPIRRMAIMLRKSIYDGIQWSVFEPNDEPLWSALRLNIGSFMNGLFRAGAFQGGKASDAYFVRCGLGDTMTQGDIDRGQVIIEVGFAPLKPAEFVIVRIQQIVGQQ